MIKRTLPGETILEDISIFEELRNILKARTVIIR